MLVKCSHTYGAPILVNTKITERDINIKMFTSPLKVSKQSQKKSLKKNPKKSPKRIPKKSPKMSPKKKTKKTLKKTPKKSPKRIPKKSPKKSPKKKTKKMSTSTREILVKYAVKKKAISADEAEIIVTKLLNTRYLDKDIKKEFKQICKDIKNYE